MGPRRRSPATYISIREAQNKIHYLLIFSLFCSLCVCAHIPFVYKPSAKRRILNTYVFMSYAGQTRRNTQCIFTMAEPQEYVKQNTGHTHNTRTTTQPNTRTKLTTDPLSSDRRLRDDGACHLPRQGGWPRRSQHGKQGRSPTRPGAR